MVDGMNARPLDSLKILDLSTLLPGPYATLILGDLGANVLRVESPTRHDLVSAIPPLVNNKSAAHHYLHRNKHSIALDLKAPQSVDIIKELILEYDILIEQFRPSVMQRFGLDYETLKNVNPKLIYCSITGYGQTGPYRNRAGHDINYLALSGVSSYTGRKETGPLPLGVQVADIAGGSHYAVMGILAAVIQRQTDGIGQHIDISMTDAAFALNAMSGAGAVGCNVNPDYETDFLNGGAFYDYYKTKDGRYLSVGGLEPAFIKNLSIALDEPKLLGLVNLHDSELQAQLKCQIRELIGRKDFDYWCEVFLDADCCVEPVLNISEAANHPQLVARKMTIDYTTQDGVTVKQIACPIKFSGSVQDPSKPAPPKGNDQSKILKPNRGQNENNS